MKYFNIGDRVEFGRGTEVVGNITQSHTLESEVWLTVVDDTGYLWTVSLDACRPNGSASPHNLTQVKPL